MMFSSKLSGRALRLRTSSGGAVTFNSASPFASRAKDSRTTRPTTAGLKALNPIPLALTANWLASIPPRTAAIIAPTTRPWPQWAPTSAGSPPGPATVHGCPRRGKIPAGRGLRFAASDTQIAVQQLGGGSEFGGDAGPYRSAFFEDVVAVRETQQRRDVLVDHEDRLAAFLEL